MYLILPHPDPSPFSISTYYIILIAKLAMPKFLLPLQLGADVWITRSMNSGEIRFQVISLGNPYVRPKNGGKESCIFLFLHMISRLLPVH
jgi:hypothetical protein